MQNLLNRSICRLDCGLERAEGSTSSTVFARWRQCALPSEHIGETWRIRLNLCFLRPSRVHNPNGKSIGSADFAWLTTVTDRPTNRPTDHATGSVTIDRIYVRIVRAMRSKNNHMPLTTRSLGCLFSVG